MPLDDSETAAGEFRLYSGGEGASREKQILSHPNAAGRSGLRWGRGSEPTICKLTDERSATRWIGGTRTGGIASETLSNPPDDRRRNADGNKACLAEMIPYRGNDTGRRRRLDPMMMLAVPAMMGCSVSHFTADGNRSISRCRRAIGIRNPSGTTRHRLAETETVAVLVLLRICKRCR